MKNYFAFFTVFLLLLFIYKLEAGKICYQAKICVHSGVERCGINSKGELRRFIDSCDMLEYNCLKKTEYTKTSQSRCLGLPPINKLKVVENKKETKSSNRGILNETSNVTDSKKIQGKTINVSEEDIKMSDDICSHSDEDEKTEEYIKNDSREQNDGTGGGITDHELEYDEINTDTENDSINEVKKVNSDTTERKPSPKTLAPGTLAVINEYWCWRADRCRKTDERVCGRDKRKKIVKKFQCECTMYKYNCEYKTDFTATDKKLCKNIKKLRKP